MLQQRTNISTQIPTTDCMNSFHLGNLIVKLPIIQGGMGVGVSLSELASAVASEGGIGVISCAGLGLIYKKGKGGYESNCILGLKEELKKARKKTNGIIGVNIMVALSNYSDMAKAAIEERVDVIFSGAGLPLDLPSYLTPDSNTKLVPIISSARAAKIICDKWMNNYHYLPDALVLEGPKAGGHLGFKTNQIFDEDFSLEKLLLEVLQITSEYKDKKDIPLIVAGGISTGSDIHRFLQLGASAVQIGSLFVPTHECDASIEFKNMYINAEEQSIKIIQSPVGMPGRAIDGEFIQQVEKGLEKPKTCPWHCIRTCDYTESPYCIMSALYNASKGNMKKGYAFAGANAYLAKKISSVKEVIEKLKEEFAISFMNKTFL